MPPPHLVHVRPQHASPPVNRSTNPGNPALYKDKNFPDGSSTTEEQQAIVFERTKQLIKLVAERTDAQQAKYMENFDHKVRTSVEVIPGDEDFIDHPPLAGRPMWDRTADEKIKKLARRARQLKKS